MGQLFTAAFPVLPGQKDHVINFGRCPLVPRLRPRRAGGGHSGHVVGTAAATPDLRVEGELGRQPVGSTPRFASRAGRPAEGS
jgi:hypothetical protein